MQQKQKKVKNGNLVKIEHQMTSKFLHSHPIKYKSGSHQFEVTAIPVADDNCWWEVVSDYKHIENGQLVRLKHKETGMYLHSHDKKSPSTHQHEVSCFWERDDNDYWTLHILDNSKFWTVKNPFVLEHVSTKHRLHSHNGHNADSGQQEVTCFSGNDNNDYWIIADRQKE